jgi:hypothetical protein
VRALALQGVENFFDAVSHWNYLDRQPSIIARVRAASKKGRCSVILRYDKEEAAHPM